MRKRYRLQRRLDIYRLKFDELYESFFPSAVEVRLIEIMGGRVWRCDRFHSRYSGRPMAFIVSRGKVLRREHFKRTGDHLILFSNDLKMALAIQGIERDIIAAYERDEQLRAKGWRIAYIPLTWLQHQPDKVRNKVCNFVYS